MTSSRKSAAPTVDDADVQAFIDELCINDPMFARTPDPQVAYMLALGAQVHRHRLTKGYAEAFARKVQRRVQWLKPSS